MLLYGCANGVNVFLDQFAFIAEKPSHHSRSRFGAVLDANGVWPVALCAYYDGGCLPKQNGVARNEVASCAWNVVDGAKSYRFKSEML